MILLVEVSFETGLFRYLFKHVFGNLEVQKYISYEGHLFLKIFQNLI